MKMRKRRIVFRVTINLTLPNDSKPCIIMVGACRKKHYHHAKSYAGWILK